MKPELKLEGKMLKMKLAESAQYDSDKDGVAAAKASLNLEIELDGLEIADELLKSSELAQKIAEKLKALGLVQ